MYGYILCNNKQELNLSATDAVYEMHENNFRVSGFPRLASFLLSV